MLIIYILYYIFCETYTYIYDDDEMLDDEQIYSIQLHLQQSYCTLELLDFFQDVTWHLTLDFALIWP